MPASPAKSESRFWQLTVTALMEQLGSNLEGLTSAEAALRLAQFGPNLIHAERKRALILQFLAKFRNPLVIILLAASALSAFTGDAASFFIISTIVLISVTSISSRNIGPDRRRNVCASRWRCAGSVARRQSP